MTQSWKMFCLGRPVAVKLLGVGVLAGGAFALWDMTIDMYPRSELPRLSIHTLWPGASPETMEREVTAPIEEVAATVKGVVHMRSVSAEGASIIDIDIEPGIVLSHAKLELREKLWSFAGSLPGGTRFPSIEEHQPARTRHLQGFMALSVSGHIPDERIRRLCLDVILPELQTVPGVGSINVYGGSIREVQILVDPLASRNVGIEHFRSVAEVLALGDGTVPGIVGSGGRILASRIRTPVRRPTDLARVFLRTEGSAMRLSAVGLVQETLRNTGTLHKTNGRSAVTLVLDRSAGSDLIRTARDVHARIELLNTRLHGEAFISIETDRSEYLRSEVQRFVRELLLCMMILLTVVVSCYGRLRAAVTVAHSLLLTLAGSVVVLRIIGYSLNLLTVGGLIIGFLGSLCGTLVVLDDSFRERCPNRMTALGAFGETGNLVLWSCAVMLVMMVPVAILPEELKTYAVQAAVTAAVALMVSAAVSLTFVSREVDWSSEMVGIRRLLQAWKGAGNMYCSFLKLCLKHRLPLTALCALVLGIPLWLLPARMDPQRPGACVYNRVLDNKTAKEIKPLIDRLLGGVMHYLAASIRFGDPVKSAEGTLLLVRVEFPPAVDFPTVVECAERMESQLRIASGPRVTTSLRVDGSMAAISIEFPAEVARSDLPARLKSRAVTLTAGMSGVRGTVLGFGSGYSSGAGQASGHLIAIRGFRYPVVQNIAHEIGSTLRRNVRVGAVEIEGNSDFSDEWASEVEAQINLEIANMLGIEPSRVAMSLVDLGSESTIGRLSMAAGEAVPVRVARVLPGGRSPGNFESEQISIDSVAHLGLGSVAAFSINPVPGSVWREDQQYVTWVSCDYRGPADAGEREIDGAIRSLKIPPGYSATRYQGDGDIADALAQTLPLAGGLSFVLLFMAAASCFESVRTSVVMIFVTPICLVGELAVYSWTGEWFGRGGYLAAFLLIGVSSSQAIVLIGRLRAAGMSVRMRIETVVDVCAEHMRPTLITGVALLAGSGVVLAVELEHDFWYGVALGVAGGVVPATLVTLLVVPTVYTLIVRTQFVS